MKQIQVALSALGMRLFRNNVGVLQNSRGDYITYGLCEGSSDLIGWRSIEITPEMVGKRVAVFMACEVKRPGGRCTIEQQRFLAAVRAAGGVGVVATSVQEVLDAIQR